MEGRGTDYDLKQVVFSLIKWRSGGWRKGRGGERKGEEGTFFFNRRGEESLEDFINRTVWQRNYVSVAR